MVDSRLIPILMEGADAWNQWRATHPERTVDLKFANLIEADLCQMNLQGVTLAQADLRRADLTNARLENADLRGALLSEACLRFSSCRACNFSDAQLDGADMRIADLRNANLHRADLGKALLQGARLAHAILSQADLTGAVLTDADLSGADLAGADLISADLRHVNLSEAELKGADLSSAILIGADLRKANISNCRVYGISAWDVKLEDAIQFNLAITLPNRPGPSVDNIEVAQFLYLLLHNPRLRGIIDTITSKVVLILGRFTPERKVILDALREALRGRNYLPIVFDFEQPDSRDLTETVSMLAHMSRFIIADVTAARSIPLELQRIVPDLPSVPVIPLLHHSDDEFAMADHFKRYPWVLETYHYESVEELLAVLVPEIINPVEQRAIELAPRNPPTA